MTTICGPDFSREAGKAVEVAAPLASADHDRLRLVHVLDDLVELEAANARRRGADTEVELSSGKVTLVVRDPAALRRWLSGELHLRVAMAMDLNRPSRATVDWIADLRRWGPCDVTVVYVAWPPGEHKRLGIAGGMDLETLQPEVEQTLRRELFDELGELAKDSQLELAVCQSFGRVDHRLALFAEERKTDLLVIGGRKRSWAERLWHQFVANGVLQLAHTNVASVAEEQGDRPDESAIPPASR